MMSWHICIAILHNLFLIKVKHKMSRLFALLLMMCACLDAAARAGSEASQASAAIPAASGMVVQGSMMSLAGSGQVIIKSIEAMGESTVIVLQGVSEGATASIRLSGQVARELSVAAGTAMKVVAMSTGHLLVASGKAIAFIPNEIGMSLLHHSRVD
jgi:hypothetical protein